MLNPNYVKQLRRVTAYQEIFETSAGQIVLHDLMKTHHMLNSSFDENTHQSARKEGERNVVLRILSLLQVDAFALSQKYKELQKQEAANKE